MLKRPLVVDLVLTARCNLQCRHCMVEAGPNKSRNLPLATVLDLVEELARSGVPYLNLTGGEPTLYPGFEQVLTRANELRLKVILTTNGTTLSDAMLDRLAGRVYLFRISVDGPDATTHGWLRGPGTFEQATAAVLRAGERHLPVTLLTTVHRANYRQLRAIAVMAQTLGARGLHVMPLLPAGRGTTLREWLLNPLEFLETCQALLAIREEFASALTVLDEIPQLACVNSQISSEQAPPRMCAAATSEMTIGPDGEVMPCPYFSGGRATGYLNSSGTLEDAWRKAWILRLTRSRDDVRVCRDCSVYGLCGSGCRAAAWHSGQPDQPDPFCWLASPPLEE